VDWLSDSAKNKAVFLQCVAGAAYGFGIGVFVLLWKEVFALALGVIIALLFSKKIDSFGHYFGAAGIILAVVLLYSLLGLFEISVFSLGFALCFALAAILDERLSDMADKNKIKNFARFFQLRPVLEITAFSIALIFSQPLIWLTIFFFDLGYNVSAIVFGEKK
jgi:hypothetical protein